MGVTTWLDRITDESNLWLSAAKAEEAKDYRAAAAQFLEDASDCLSRGSKVRAALSCYCAAECVSRIGARKEAQQLYYRAGKLYTEIADHGVSGSIREALWALQRAYGCFVLADEAKDSEMVFEAHRLMARRANPFSIGSDWFEMPKLVRQHEDGPTATELPLEVETEMEGFLALAEAEALKRSNASIRQRRSGGMNDGPESFVSQLG